MVLPGLVNTHTHAPMVMYRGLADDLALMDWLEHYIFPARGQDGVTRNGPDRNETWPLLEMIRSGTTTFADMYYFEEEVGRAARKARCARRGRARRSSGSPSPDAKTPDESLKRTEALIREFAGDPLIVPAVAPHAPYTLDGEWLVASRALSDRSGIPILIHVAETEDEVKTTREKFALTPVAYLAVVGLPRPARRRRSRCLGERRTTSRRSRSSASASHTTPRAT